MSGRSPEKQRFAMIRDVTLAMEMPLMLVGGVAVGGLIGYLLDKAFHTWPWLTLLFVFLGFGGGVWEIIRSIGRMDHSGGSR